MIFLLWLLNCASLYSMMHSLSRSKKDIKWQWTLVCILQFLLLILTQWNQLLLVLFYLALFLSKLVIFQILDENHHWRMIVTNISFISMISCHLIAIALIALTFQVDMSTIIHTPQFTISCYMLFLLFDSIVNIFITKKSEQITKVFFHTVHHQYRNFEYFLWICDIFLIIQSMLCQQDHFPIYISIFLTCNDILLLTLVFCFIRNIYEINEQAYVEELNQMLQHESNMRRKNMENMKTYADYDILTNAHSRKYTMQYLQSMIAHQYPFSIAFIDLDKLKVINDVHGHSAGDQYLRSFAESMEVFLHDGDILGRIGGDEFIFVMKNLNKEEAEKRMAYIYDKIQTTTFTNSTYFSYGVAAYDAHKHDINTLIQAADDIMYQQKQTHRKEENAC